MTLGLDSYDLDEAGFGWISRDCSSTTPAVSQSTAAIVIRHSGKV
jgi:hypothetical protein